jgi:hypothetical protein
MVGKGSRGGFHEKPHYNSQQTKSNKANPAGNPGTIHGKEPREGRENWSHVAITC